LPFFLDSLSKPSGTKLLGWLVNHEKAINFALLFLEMGPEWRRGEDFQE
jgi:hypothetical protein